MGNCPYHRDAAKREKRAKGLDGWRAVFAALEAVLDRHAFLSGREAPGRVDFKHYAFLRIAQDQVLHGDAKQKGMVYKKQLSFEASELEASEFQI